MVQWFSVLASGHTKTGFSKLMCLSGNPVANLTMTTAAIQGILGLFLISWLIRHYSSNQGTTSCMVARCLCHPWDGLSSTYETVDCDQILTFRGSVNIFTGHLRLSGAM